MFWLPDDDERSGGLQFADMSSARSAHGVGTVSLNARVFTLTINWTSASLRR
jgi:hypothetical protein